MLEISFGSGKYPFIWKYLFLPHLYIGVMLCQYLNVLGIYCHLGAQICLIRLTPQEIHMIQVRLAFRWRAQEQKHVAT